MGSKSYKYDGEEFEVHEPLEDRIAVTGQGMTACITVNRATGMYREAMGSDGWGPDQSTVEDALDRACRRILDKSKKLSQDTLVKGLHDFYGSLK